jgi:hypothetical protein
MAPLNVKVPKIKVLLGFFALLFLLIFLQRETTLSTELAKLRAENAHLRKTPSPEPAEFRVENNRSAELCITPKYLSELKHDNQHRRDKDLFAAIMVSLCDQFVKSDAFATYAMIPFLFFQAYSLVHKRTFSQCVDRHRTYYEPQFFEGKHIHDQF